MLLLAGDVGGTKTNLALFSRDYSIVAQAKYASQDYPSLESILDLFLGEHQNGMEIVAASFGVPGTILDGVSRMTNLSWEVDQTKLKSYIGIEKIHLVNDLVALANAIPVLPESHRDVLHRGQPREHGTLLVVAPGTGLGVAFLVWDGEHYRVCPSEGGHTSFSPSNDFELGLLNYMTKRIGRVSTERVCSGLGIPNIYQYLRDEKLAEEPAALAERLSIAVDWTPIIVTDALDPEHGSELSRLTMKLFTHILGATTGDLALSVLAHGGVYLGGGIPPRILKVLKSGEFMKGFCDKGRFRRMMENIPIYVILNSQASLLGAARIGLESLS